MRIWAFAVIMFLVLFFQTDGTANSGGGEVFRWVDERGGIHFTDNFQNVPPQYRSKTIHRSFKNNSNDLSSEKTDSRQGLNEAPVVVNYYKEGPSILVRGLVNWSLPVAFHLDTGATITAITREDAAALGIDYLKAPETSIKMADGRQASLPMVSLSSVKIGDAEVESLKAIVSNVRLLGLNFLSHFRVTVDSVNGQIVFERKTAKPLKESESISYEKKRKAHELEARINQIQLAVEDLQKMIKQRESIIRTLRKKKSHIETQLHLLREQKTSSRRESLLREGEERLKMIKLSIEREDIAINHHKKDIEIHRDNIDYYQALIYNLQ